MNIQTWVKIYAGDSITHQVVRRFDDTEPAIEFAMTMFARIAESAVYDARLKYIYHDDTDTVEIEIRYQKVR